MTADSDRSIAGSLTEVFTGAVISFFGAILLRVSGLIEKVLVARFFDPAGYGTVVLGITVLSLATVLSLSGLKTGVVRYLPRQNNQAERSGVVTFALVVTAGLGVVVSLTLFLSAGWVSRNLLNEPTAEPVLRVFALAVLPASVGKLGIATAQGRKDVRGKTLINEVLFPLSRVGFVAVALVVSASVVGVSLAYLGGFAVMAAAAIYYIYSTVGFGPRDTPNRKAFVRFSLPLLFSGSMAFVSDSIDTILIGYYLGATDIGFYNAAYPLANLVILAPGLLAVIFVPLVSEYHKEGDQDGMRRLYKITTRWTICVTLPGYLLMVISPDAFIGAVFGDKYFAGTTALVIVATGFFYHTALGMNGGALSMVGDSDFFMSSNLVNAGLNFGLNVLLIPVIGITGAAVATAVSYSVANSLVSLRLYQKSTVHPLSRKSLVSIAVLFLVVVVTSELVGVVVGGIIWVVTSYMISAVIFLYLYYLLELYEPEELEMLDRIVKKRL